MKLHESPSPNARRVHIAMAEKSIEIERVAVDIRAGENISAEYLAKTQVAAFPCWNWTTARSSVSRCQLPDTWTPLVKAPHCLETARSLKRKSTCGSGA